MGPERYVIWNYDWSTRVLGLYRSWPRNSNNCHVIGKVNIWNCKWVSNRPKFRVTDLLKISATYAIASMNEWLHEKLMPRFCTYIWNQFKGVKEYQGSEKILTFLLEKRPLFQRSNGRGPSRELHKRESSLLVLLDPAHQHHIHEKPVGLLADNDDNPFKVNIDVLAYLQKKGSSVVMPQTT